MAGPMQLRWGGVAMSSSQTALRVVSVWLAVTAASMIAPALLCFGFAYASPSLVMGLLLATSALLNVVLGCLGWLASIQADRATRMLPIVLVALLVNAASVLYFLMYDGMIGWPIVSALSMLAFAVLARRVSEEARA